MPDTAANAAFFLRPFWNVNVTLALELYSTIPRRNPCRLKDIRLTRDRRNRLTLLNSLRVAYRDVSTAKTISPCALQPESVRHNVNMIIKQLWQQRGDMKTFHIAYSREWFCVFK